MLGIAFGAIAILTDRLTHWTEIVASQMNLPSIHIDFPASLLIYPGGAIIVEILYRLFTIPFFLWLFSAVSFKDKYRTPLFWGMAALTSFIEPAGDLGLAKFGIGMMSAVFFQDYALNFAQAILFRKYGFAVSIALRVWFYLIWHVIYALLIR